MAIILARHGRPTKKLERTIIQQESYLQQYIYEHPDTLPLDQLQADIRPLVLVREFPTTSGPIDALAVDQNANIYLIETKLYKNPDKRLVLAQVLDYGAALWKGYSDPDDFIRRLDSLMQERTGKGFSQRITEFYAFEADATSEFIESLKNTTASGQFRFVVLMDVVEERLKNLIAYVNANSGFDVLGVALDFYQHDNIDILIPTLHGAEAKKVVTSTRTNARRSWDEQSFFADASARISAEQLRALRSLYDWAETNADEIAFGPGAIGSFNPKFTAVCPRSVFTARSDGTLRLNFGWLDEPESAKAWREQFGQSLKQSGFSIPGDFSKRWPALPVTEWVPRVSDFIRILSNEVESARGAAEPVSPQR
jgi:hypothetical protein